MINGDISGGILFIVLSLIFLFPKTEILIAGLNTMSKEKKKRYNIKRIKLCLSAVLMFSGVILGIGGFFDNGIFSIVSWLLSVVLIIGGVIFINVSKLFRAS